MIYVTTSSVTRPHHLRVFAKVIYADACEQLPRVMIAVLGTPEVYSLMPLFRNREIGTAGW
ncbi:hypothetical protein GCM10010187_08400 [Actinomadura coerulea]|nr:hypothetical protein GCM10010187_08400 [Actinomadura coerulea]